MSEWDWRLTETARRDFDALDDHARDRIASKLDEIVTDEWREPHEHLEPLQGAHTRSSVSVRSDSAAESTEPNAFSTSCGFESAVGTPIAATTTDTFADLLNRLFSER